jgi:hypothetical protein
VDVWFSSATAIATSGRCPSRPANAMNQVVLTPGRPVSAVPVLPPMRYPGICAAVPVPAWTTLTIMSSICFAWTGPTARLSRSCRVRATVLPCGETTFSTTHGRITIPALPIPPATIAICSGVTSIRSWPNAIRPASTSWSRAGYQSSWFL